MNPFEEYKQQKKQHADQKQPMSQEQRLKQELRKLPQGKDLMNWICQEVANRIGDPVLWQYADQNEATQQRTQRVKFINGSDNSQLLITEVNRQEIAQTRAMGQSWIDQFMAAIENAKGQGGGAASKMHEKFEQDLSERFSEKMDKITGNDE
jgi:hypothetical protein